MIMAINPCASYKGMLNSLFENRYVLLTGVATLIGLHVLDHLYIVNIMRQ